MMTDEQKNKNLEEHLIFFGRTKDLLDEIAFKIKGFNKCIFKFPYNKNTVQLSVPVDGSN